MMFCVPLYLFMIGGASSKLIELWGLLCNSCVISTSCTLFHSRIHPSLRTVCPGTVTQWSGTGVMAARQVSYSLDTLGMGHRVCHDK